VSMCSGSDRRSVNVKVNPQGFLTRTCRLTVPLVVYYKSKPRGKESI
jgi:hypothetical protein